MPSIIDYMRWEILEWSDHIVAAIPGRTGRLIRGKYWQARMARLGPKPSIGCGFRALGPANISIGANFFSTGNGFLSAEDGGIEAGEYLAINNNVQINASLGGFIQIGNHVLIGPNTVLRASDHVFMDPSVVIQEQGHTGGNIVIEDDVWLGSNVVIVPGVRIGRGSVVAAGAVVTRDVEPWSVVGGVPAKMIKKRAAELLETI